jgi:hypothetical protein
VLNQFVIQRLVRRRLNKIQSAKRELNANFNLTKFRFHAAILPNASLIRCPTRFAILLHNSELAIRLLAENLKLER